VGLITTDLAERALANEPRAVARAMRLVDDRAPGSRELLRALWPHTGRAWILGVTGSPGVGKSTLCDQLIAAYRARGSRVAVVAVDPTSPYSGGAILGDRIRMSRHSTDDGVFIRSLATRGHLGGLSRSARDVVRVFDACGYGVVLVETVGVGQDELEITRTAHTNLVVVAPGMGDDVQALKAGILECADVFAVNKSDREGADAAARDLELMIALATESWRPIVAQCVATSAEGIPELVVALERHRAWAAGTDAGHARRMSRLAEEVRDALREALIEVATEELGERIEQAALEVDARLVDPYTAVDRLTREFRARSIR
jgi:LAO/AO transport system kinase